MKKVYLCDLQTGAIMEFDSQTKAANHLSLVGRAAPATCRNWVTRDIDKPCIRGGYLIGSTCENAKKMRHVVLLSRFCNFADMPPGLIQYVSSLLSPFISVLRPAKMAVRHRAPDPRRERKQ